MGVQSFRDSIAWQKAMELSTEVYSVTKTFPSDERFGLTNQLRRASVSIPSNIAEGQGRLTTGEFIQFLGIARGSVLEVETQLELSVRLGYAPPERMESIQRKALELGKILNAALVTLRTKKARSSR